METPSALEIAVPAKKSWGLAVFNTFLLAGWAYGATAATRPLLAENITPAARLFISIWLIGWTLAGAVFLYTVLWKIFGIERITLSSGILSIKRDLFGTGKKHEYVLDQVKNLRVVAPENDGSDLTTPWARHSPGGLIAFDYGSKTYRLAAGINESEAQSLVAQLAAAIGNR